MAPRLRALLGCSAALLAGCGEPVEPAVPALAPPPTSAGPAVPVPSATAQEEARSPFATPVLPPLVKDARAPCDIAKETRKGADLALGQGRSYRAVRLVEKADRQCPSTASTSWSTRLDALSKLGRDDAAKDLAKEITASPSADATVAASARAALAKASPSTLPAADTLLTAALAAQKTGAADARAQMDRALVRLEQETSKAPETFLDTAERKPLAISNDGATAAVGVGNTVVLIDAKTLHPQRFFDGPSPTLSAVLSTDGKLLATVHADAVDVWSATTGKRGRHLVWADEEPQAAVFSSDGKRLIVGSERSFDAAIRVWNLETGDSADSFTLPREGGTTTLALSRDDKQVAIGTDRGTLQLWALSPHKLVASLAKRDSFLEKVVSISFSPKGDRVAAFFGAGKLATWETKQGKSLWEVTTSDWFGEGVAAFSADGARVLAGTTAGFRTALREWDAATGAELQNKPTQVEPAFFSQDGRFALGVSHDLLGVLDIVAGTEITTSNAAARIGSLAFAPARTIVLTIDGEKAFRVLTPQAIRRFPVEDTYGSTAVSLDGRSIAHATYRDVLVWDLEKGSPVSGYPAFPETSPTVRFGPQSNDLRLWFSRFDVLSLFAASPGAPAGKEIFRLERKDLGHIHIPEYGRWAAIESDKKVFLLDSADGTLRTAEDDSQDRIRQMDVSADGTSLFVVREERLARFDTATGKATHPVVPTGCYVDVLSASFDGSRVLAFCSDRATLFSYGAGRDAPITRPIGVGRVTYEKVALAPHGDLIVTGHDDGTLRVWDTAGAMRAELRPVAGADAMLVRSAAGRVLLAGKDASTIEDHLSCRVGPRALPFVVCADALGDDDVLADALAPGSP